MRALGMRVGEDDPLELGCSANDNPIGSPTYAEAHAPVRLLDLGMAQKGFRINTEQLHGQESAKTRPFSST